MKRVAGSTVLVVLGWFSLLGVTTSFLWSETAIAAPTSTPNSDITTTSPDQPAQKLLGQWLSQDGLEGETLLAVFTNEGKLFLVSGTNTSGNGIGRQFQYQVDSTTPTHLDIVVGNNAIVKTLFEFTPEGNLRLQILGTRPGQPRPTALAENATVFQKISDSTTLPPGVELKQP